MSFWPRSDLRPCVLALVLVRVTALYSSDCLTSTPSQHEALGADRVPLLFALGSLVPPCLLRDLSESESPAPRCWGQVTRGDRVPANVLTQSPPHELGGPHAQASRARRL